MAQCVTGTCVVWAGQVDHNIQISWLHHPFPFQTQVTVTDGGTSPKQSAIWVVVQVLDENDNKPQFPEKVYQIKLPERDRKKRGEPIYRAFAFDRDEGPNAEISYSIVDGNDDGKFFIDPKTGMVSSRKQFTAGSYDILTVRFSSRASGVGRALLFMSTPWISRSLMWRAQKERWKAAFWEPVTGENSYLAGWCPK